LFIVVYYKVNTNTVIFTLLPNNKTANTVSLLPRQAKN